MESRWKISWEDHYRSEQRRCRRGITVVAVRRRIDWAMFKSARPISGRNRVRQFFPPVQNQVVTYQA
ncbi:MAG: hypothetical protein DYH03_06695 [Nitrospira sp. NTP1]|nr:hypothetical protein [Nitrospira sp. NTP1]